MYIPESFSASLLLMVLSMVCWGSWANAFNLCRGRYRFELFYWDFALGVLLGSAALFITLGPGFSQLSQITAGANFLWAVLAGCVFSIGNVLLVAAISVTGMAVAFPVCIGLALLLGVGLSWLISPGVPMPALLAGAVLLLFSICLDAAAYRAMTRQTAYSNRGLAIAILGGVFMGLFPPCLQKALVGPAALDPYAASVILGIGVVVCTVGTNWLFMRHPITGGGRVRAAAYFGAAPAHHGLGLLGGAVWAAGMVFNSIAGNKVSIAVSYAFGTGATLVAALWGVLVWKEFRGAPRRSFHYLIGTFISFLAGIGVIAWAKVTMSAN
jgi:glucose uptake protein